ncbi:MAG TPA: hypothetical protein VJV78_02835 [Polyangiales bacterium]|nr:hypothetical protein [Polyangiales bacterium]
MASIESIRSVTSTHTFAAFAHPPTLQYGGIAAWLTAPAGAVVQVVQPMRGTTEAANWLVGPVFDAIQSRFPGNNSLILVFDLALMTSRSAAARSIFLAKAREVGKRFGAGYFVPPISASAANRQATRASLALIRALGVHIELVDSSHQAVEMLHLRAI